MTSVEKLDYAQLIVRKIMLKDMALSGILLWINKVLGDNTKPAYAYTYGQNIHLCNPFFDNANEAQQMMIIIHETLHIALQHPRRLAEVRARKGEKYNHQWANIAADAIVQRPIQKTPWLECIYKITAEDIVDKKDLAKIPGAKWSVEMLYNYIESMPPDKQKKLCDNFGKPENDDVMEATGEDADGHGAKIQGRIWNERLKRCAGTGTDNMLREILGDLPEPKVCWEREFKDFLIAHVMPTTTIDPCKPSRTMLASKGKLGYFSPGIQREMGVKKVGIIVDTSGSIDGPILQKFIAESNSIQEQIGCELVLVVADAEVQSVTFHREPIEKDFKFKGGGGTDFRPAIKELEKHEIDCAVYLTDMCGSFPEKAPSYPILWASICEQQPPFGRYVKVDIED